MICVIGRSGIKGFWRDSGDDHLHDFFVRWADASGLSLSTPILGTSVGVTCLLFAKSRRGML